MTLSTVAKSGWRLALSGLLIAVPLLGTYAVFEWSYMSGNQRLLLLGTAGLCVLGAMYMAMRLVYTARQIRTVIGKEPKEYLARQRLVAELYACAALGSLLATIYSAGLNLDRQNVNARWSGLSHARELNQAMLGSKRCDPAQEVQCDGIEHAFDLVFASLIVQRNEAATSDNLRMLRDRILAAGSAANKGEQARRVVAILDDVKLEPGLPEELVPFYVLMLLLIATMSLSRKVGIAAYEDTTAKALPAAPWLIDKKAVTKYAPAPAAPAHSDPTPAG